MHRIKTRQLINLVLLSLFLPALASGEEATFSATADGMAMINNNTAKARVMAIDDAIKKSVEQGVAALVSSEDIAFNLETIKDGIYSNATEYIQHYRVVSEKTTGNIYQITLDAVIIKSLLGDDLSALGLVSLPEQLPSLLLMVVEKNEIEKRDTFWWKKGRGKTGPTETENILKEIFSSRGFEVVSHGTAPEIKTSPGYNNEQLDTIQLLAFGEMFNADVILYGHVLTRVEDLKADAQATSTVTKISLLAIDREREETIGETANEEWATEDEIKRAGERSLFTALNEASIDVMTKIASFAGKEESEKLRTIEMTISGVTSYTAFVKFKDIIEKNISAIKEIAQRGIGGGKATLDIKIDDTAQHLADKLTMIGYEGFSIDITGISEENIEVLLKESESAGL